MKFSFFLFLEHLQKITKAKGDVSQLCQMKRARRFAALDLDDYDLNSTDQPTDAASIRVRRIAEACANVAGDGDGDGDGNYS